MLTGVVNILSHMCTEFTLTPGGETLRDYVIPSLGKISSDEVILRLRSAGVTTAAAAAALVNYLLSMNSIAEAARVGKTTLRLSLCLACVSCHPFFTYQWWFLLLLLLLPLQPTMCFSLLSDFLPFRPFLAQF
jgi:hypothetical protein